jgi:hypothetical protein
MANRHSADGSPADGNRSEYKNPRRQSSAGKESYTDASKGDDSGGHPADCNDSGGYAAIRNHAMCRASHRQQRHARNLYWGVIGSNVSAVGLVHGDVSDENRTNLNHSHKNKDAQQCLPNLTEALGALAQFSHPFRAGF